MEDQASPICRRRADALSGGQNLIDTSVSIIYGQHSGLRYVRTPPRPVVQALPALAQKRAENVFKARVVECEY